MKASRWLSRIALLINGLLLCYWSLVVGGVAVVGEREQFGCCSVWQEIGTAVLFLIGPASAVVALLKITLRNPPDDPPTYYRTGDDPKRGA